MNGPKETKLPSRRTVSLSPASGPKGMKVVVSIAANIDEGYSSINV